MTLFVMLRQQINGSWINSNYTYTEAGTIVPAAITAPTPGTTLPSGPVAFTWSAGTGPTQYQLLVGTTGFGSYDVYYSGNTKLTSETVTIPSNGVTLFVMLRQQINGSWVNSNYTYTEPGTIVPAAITVSHAGHHPAFWSGGFHMVGRNRARAVPTAGRNRRVRIVRRVLLRQHESDLGDRNHSEQRREAVRHAPPADQWELDKLRLHLHRAIARSIPSRRP